MYPGRGYGTGAFASHPAGLVVSARVRARSLRGALRSRTFGRLSGGKTSTSRSRTRRIKSAQAQSRGEISTLERTGHFYFALTRTLSPASPEPQLRRAAPPPPRVA